MNCPSCHQSMDEATVFTIKNPNEKRLWFGGYQCQCGRKSWRATPTGPEITELRWRTGQLSTQLGLDPQLLGMP